ncbi:PepSY domain-containing protein [Rothia sp. AR01]|uniref:PepSY domain-containing protein n=1 Tax=Rothia santali TaxID=2949643 RepID=A0A9X2HBQ1_9MICC|nr:PepSY-associated TM helix domain-containing protein [Rothia santali]MCP3426381.1 PepSY domain-containing protein [Rothia santali]
MVLRLHFYAGILIGPFILIAAATGALYALSPQIEKAVYHHELYISQTGEHVDIDDQVATAIRYYDDQDRAAGGAGDVAAEQLSAVRPAPAPDETTRVMFIDPEEAEASESHAVFVNPVTNEVQGELTAYGSSGALPLRTWIDQLHRSLNLGDPGRIYSELAASWLWVVALGGLILWIPQLTSRIRAGRTKRRALRESVLPVRGLKGRAKILNWHYATGIWLLIGMGFLSATGLTWSQYAGTNVADLRTALSWETPAASTALGDGEAAPAGEHAGHAGHGHAGHDMSSMTGPMVDVSRGYDEAIASAQAAGIDSPRLEITPSPDPAVAWVVKENDRHFPTNVDSAAVDPTTMQVTDYVSFADDYSLPAKMAEWGIAMHMGLWMGLANQLVLLLLAIGLCAMVIWGYLMWFKRRPTLARPKAPKPGLPRAPWWAWIAVGVPAVILGLFIPLLGIPLAIFVVIDVLWQLRNRGGQKKAGPRAQTRRS